MLKINTLSVNKDKDLCIRFADSTNWKDKNTDNFIHIRKCLDSLLNSFLFIEHNKYGKIYLSGNIKPADLKVVKRKFEVVGYEPIITNQK